MTAVTPTASMHLRREGGRDTRYCYIYHRMGWAMVAIRGNWAPPEK